MSKPTIGILYDFDKTLCTTDMQEYDFIKNLGITPDAFWGEAGRLARQYEMERILAYMLVMIRQCKEKGIPLTEEYLRSCGAHVELFGGVTTWFDRINAFGKSLGVNIEHYVISSGIKEIIEGSEISNRFKKIFACQYLFDEDGKAVWPKIAINYTQKTQYVFRISKGVYDETENKKVNDKVREREIPYQNMIYFGDGITDIPCMTLIKKQGGVSIAVYQKGEKNKVTDLLLDDRVNYICSADYQEGGDLDSLVKCIIQEKALTHKLQLKQREQRRRESKKQTPSA